MNQEAEVRKVIEYVVEYEEDFERKMEGVPRPTDIKPNLKDLKECKSIEEVMEWMRNESWDLEAALFTINEALGMEPNNSKHGSCQDILSRLPVALALRYGVSEEAFWDWDT